MNNPAKLPTQKFDRERLREKGQFWTPDWIADAMVAYALSNGSEHILDPAVGAGVFLRAAKKLAGKLNRTVHLWGTEIYPEVLEQARHNGLSEEDIEHIAIRDFVLDPSTGPFQAIVANPPYIRHHRLPSSTKYELRRIAVESIGTALDGRAGLHIYFLIRALQVLDKGGRLAFIMPADTCEGVFSSTLWTWITRNYRLDSVITFAPSASPFPGIDTNPVIFMIANEAPQEKFLWAKCRFPKASDLKNWVMSGFDESADTLEVHKRFLSEGLATGFSRPPMEGNKSSYILGEFAYVMRGIATGANEYFFLTARRAKNLQLPEEFLIPAIGRTRDVPGSIITLETIKNLESKNRPNLLFSPDGRTLDEFPESVREYLRQGETRGIHRQSLIATRRPWYKMETRPPPPILFAYLGRRNTRFVRNLAEVVPLTGFLCVYPVRDNPDFVEQLWSVLQRPETISNLSLVGKSYGSGAIKVEPRALERLPLPQDPGLVIEPGDVNPASQTKLL